jgi:hypothetical protein
MKVAANDDALMRLLTQLAENSAHRQFLLGRMQQVYEICQVNHALRQALERLLAASTFDEASTCYRWDRTALANELETFRRFFDYLYFSSNDFLDTVL